MENAWISLLYEVDLKPTFTIWEILSKVLCLIEPLCPPLKNSGNTHALFIELLWGPNDLVYLDCLAHCRHIMGTQYMVSII